MDSVTKLSKILSTLTLVSLLLPLTAGATQFRFEPGCPLPYEAIKQAHPIDEACNLSGGRWGISLNSLSVSGNTLDTPILPSGGQGMAEKLITRNVVMLENSFGVVSANKRRFSESSPGRASLDCAAAERDQRRAAGVRGKAGGGDDHTVLQGS